MVPAVGDVGQHPVDVERGESLHPRHCRQPREGSPGGADSGWVTVMGDDVVSTAYTREQRQRYREKVRQCLDVFERMLAESSFEFERPLTGLEIELNLVHDDFIPAIANAAVLQSVA